MAFVLPTVLALSLALGTIPVLDSDGDDFTGPSLTLPDTPSIPLPPGTHVFGPTDRQQKPQVSLPEKAPSTKPDEQRNLSPAERRKARIDDLLGRLAQSQDSTEADAITTMLARLWLQSGSDTADLLMDRALTCISKQDYKTAGDLLTKVVVLQPGWAEAWNKLATVHFLQDDDVASMVDISHALAIEPRHFGAMSGMGFILHREGNDKDALTVLRRASKLNPQDDSVNALIKELAPEVDGRDI